MGDIDKSIRERIEKAQERRPPSPDDRPNWSYSIVCLRPDISTGWVNKPYRKLLRWLMTGDLVLACERCKNSMYVTDLIKWRNTGAGAMCEVCVGPGAKLGSIVADDNLEVITLGRNYEPILPERARQFYEDWEKTGVLKWLVKKGGKYAYEEVKQENRL